MSLLSEQDALKSLLRRLPANHSYRKFLEVELHRSIAGKSGEDRVEKKFKEFYLDEEFHMLKNISLRIKDWKVQFDFILLTESCAVIVESKNISGKIHFIEETGEFFRYNNDDMKDVFDDLVIQLKKEIQFLTIWLNRRKIYLPVDGLIVFTPKQCEFISKPKNVYVCKTYQLNDYLHKILQLHPLKAEIPKLMKIKKTIESNQVPYQRIPLCEYYHINIEDLEYGVYCLECKRHSMHRHKRSWLCNQCGHRNRNAHKLAIQEFFSLAGTTITNQQFRSFCKIESQPVATRLLIECEMEASGNSKGRKYFLKS